MIKSSHDISSHGDCTEDLTERLTEEQKWERGRFVEFHMVQRGTRFGRILQTFSRGAKKDRVLIGLFNPYTKMYGNRGGYRHYQTLVDKKMVYRFYGKSRSKKNGTTDTLKAAESDDETVGKAQLT